MDTKVKISGINVAYPVPSINQSSQGFRDNWAAIANQLKVAGDELSKLLSTKIYLKGDVEGNSLELGDREKLDTTNILVNLKAMPGVAGTYDSKTQNISFTVDGKGRISAVTATAKPTFAAGALSPTIQHWGTSQAAKSITLPVLTIDKYGNITAVNPVTLEGFDTVGQNLEKGSIYAGDSHNTAAKLPAPLANAGSESEYWVLSLSPNEETGLSWRKLPIGADLTNLVVNIQEGKGIDITGDSANPMINLDVNSLTSFVTDGSLEDLDTFAIYDASRRETVKLSFAKLQENLMFLRVVADDPAPVLGGNLDVNTKTIVSASRVRIGDGKSPVAINGTTWPLEPAPGGSILVATATGALAWKGMPEAAAVSIKVGQGLVTNPLLGIEGTGTINLNFGGLDVATSADITDYLPVYRSSTGETLRMPFSNLGSIRGNVVVVSSTYGDDTLGSGSFNSPYASIAKALESIPLDNTAPITLLVLSGSYGNPTVESPVGLDVILETPNLSIVGLNPLDTIINGRITIMPELQHTYISGVTLQVSDLDTSAEGYALGISQGCDHVVLDNCRLLRSDNADGSLRQVVSLAGRNTAPVLFNNCEIHGDVDQAMVPATDDDNLAVQFTNNKSSEGSLMGVQVTQDTKTEINNVNFLGPIFHAGGLLTLNNISSINGGVKEGIYSGAVDGILALNNVSMRYRFGSTWSFSKIKKVGQCGYLFNNVVRDPTLDEVAGNRLDYGTPGVDIGERMRVLEAGQAAHTINTNISNSWYLNLTANATITLDAPAMAYAGTNSYIRSITVTLQQDNTGGRSAVFITSSGNPIAWDTEPSHPGIAGGANKITMFTFMYVAGTWIGARSFMQG